MRHVVIIAAALAAMPVTGFANLLAYQGFDGNNYTSGTSLIGKASGGSYTSGGVLAGNSNTSGGTAYGWSGNWIIKYADPYTNNLATVSSSGLSAPSGVANIGTTGNAATITTPTRANATSTFIDIATESAIDRSQPVYVSFLFSRPASNPNQNLYLALTSGIGGSEIAEVGSFSSTLYGIKIGSSSASTASTTIPDGTASLVVIKLDYGTANSNNLYTNMTVTMWINPTSAIEADQTAGATRTGTNTSGYAAVGGIRMAAGYITGTAPLATNTGTFDEIRIGTSFADVVPVPEPAALGVGALGCGALLVAGRRK